MKKTSLVKMAKDALKVGVLSAVLNLGACTTDETEYDSNYAVVDEYTGLSCKDINENKNMSVDMAADMLCTDIKIIADKAGANYEFESKNACLETMTEDFEQALEQNAVIPAMATIARYNKMARCAESAFENGLRGQDIEARCATSGDEYRTAYKNQFIKCGNQYDEEGSERNRNNNVNPYKVRSEETNISCEDLLDYYETDFVSADVEQIAKYGCDRKGDYYVNAGMYYNSFEGESVCIENYKNALNERLESGEITVEDFPIVAARDGAAGAAVRNAVNAGLHWQEALDAADIDFADFKKKYIVQKEECLLMGQ